MTAILSAATKVEALRSVSLKKEYVWIALIGIVLPLVALSVELAFRICASHSFDPFPSNAHALLFALIPISNLLILMSVASDFSEHYAFLTLLNGMASGIALTYALMFLPLIPVSLLFVFLLGFGLLGLAPLLAFLSTLRAGGIICNLARKHNIYFEPDHAKHLGHLLIIASVVAIELPSTLTRIHLDMASHPAQTQVGIDWLRKYGSQEVMLRACYERSGRATDILGSLFEAAHPLDVAKAREIYYTVTGKPFNSVPIPLAARATMQHAGVTIDGKSIEDEFDVDTDVAGENISSISRGLTATSSKIVGEAVPSLALAKMTWTIELQNLSKYKREARAKVTLPSGGVVTLASLWIDGRRLYATISERKAARQVYRRSLFKEDHPLLVSACGPDQILVQCYPISPYSKVDVELVIVAPFQVRSLEDGSIVLPSLSEQNFAVNEQADCKLESGSLVGNGKIWNCPVNPGLAAYNVELPIEGVSFAASQELTQTVPWVPNKLIVVVDGSVSVAPYYEEVLNALRTLPNGLLTKVVLVSDTNQLVGDFTEPDKPAFLNGLDTMKSASCVGGQDDTKQLSAAVSFAVQNPDTSVVWIHGAQPLGAADRSTLHTWLNKDLQHPILYDMQIASGPNELLNGISFAPGLQKVQRFGSVQSDLQDLFSRWANRTATLQFKRSCTRSPNTASLEDAQAHDREIAVLAANQRILAESNEDISKVSDDSYLLAEGLHIVTPISSAIASRRTRIRVHQHQQGSLLASVKQNVRAIRRVPAHMFDPVVGQLNNLSSAGGAASPGPAQSWTMPALPPLDLRYGQSNEVGQLKEYGSDSVVSGFRKSSAAPRVMHDLMEESTKDEEEPTQADSASRLVGALLNGSHTVSAIGPIMKSSEDKLVQKNSQSSDESGEQKPVPEPDSLWMILLSVCFIAFMIFQKWRVRFHHCR